MTAEVMASPTPYQLLPPLSKEEYDALRADIAESGIAVPIDVDEDGNILDGHHRAWIAADLGVDCPRRVVSGLTEQGKRNYARRVNALRRSLTAEQRREQVAQMRREGLSQAEIARTLGVSQQTVSNDLRDVTNLGNEDDLPDTITDTLGRKQPAKKATHECACGESFTRPVWHCQTCGNHWDVGQVCDTCAEQTAVVNTTTGEITDPPTEPTTKPRARNRKPLPDAFRATSYDLTKVTEKLSRLVEDERFPRNAQQVSQLTRGDLLRAADALADVIQRLP